MKPADPHAKCDPTANAYKLVKCDGCSEEYICTPEQDYYCSHFDSGHYCEGCLIRRAIKAYNDACVERDRHLHGAILVETITPDGQTVDTRMQEL